MSYQLSACVFIRDTFTGAFCLFESMASVLHLVDEIIVMDLGSTDGTYETLAEIAGANPKVKLVRGQWPEIDAGAFATLANDLVGLCANQRVLYLQADEIWHEHLLGLMEQRFEAGLVDLAFWRIQYRDNFQKVKWFPHLVHRVGTKDRLNFVGDGMSTDRTWDAPICSNFDGSWFPRWGSMPSAELPVHEMITDVSLVGGFRDNIVERRALHAPFWHEEPTIEGLPASEWQRQAAANPDWTKAESPFNLPRIMRGLVGMTRYRLRPEVLAALKSGETRGLVGI